MAELTRTPQVVIEDNEIFEAHEGGKLSVDLKSPLDTQRALSIAYTPGVAQVSRAIASDATLAKKYTWAHRLVAVVSDGSAVLGLGDIGASASLPVMEGKSALFKTFGGLDSMTGSDAAAPMSPRPSTALPSLTTATSRFAHVYFAASVRSAAMALLT